MTNSDDTRENPQMYRFCTRAETYQSSATPVRLNRPRRSKSHRMKVIPKMVMRIFGGRR